MRDAREDGKRQRYGAPRQAGYEKCTNHLKDSMAMMQALHGSLPADEI